jgi:site-specific DNA recombinase
LATTIVDLYCRVSTDPQDDGTSMDEQERAGREYCEQHGLIVGMVHRETFTGYQYRERKKLSLMRDRYRDGKIQGVVIRTLDRLSRSQTHVAILMEEMEHYGVTLYSVKEVIDDTPMGKFARMVLAFVAEMEREKIMDRTMTGRTNAVLAGSMKAVSTHKLRYGFAWADATKTKIILSETEVAPGMTEADVVRWMAAQYAEGTATYTIRQQLNERGIPSPTGRQWLDATIMRILGDRRITGMNATAFRIKAKRYKTHHDTLPVPDGTYPAIIPTELFEQIKRRMAMNKVSASRASKNPEEFLLRAGYVRCSVCGWAMGARTDTKHNWLCYRCRQHGSIVSKPLDAAIWQKVEELAEHVTLIEQAVQLATNDNKLERDAAAIDASIDHWQQSAANYLKDLGKPDLIGESRDAILIRMNDANIMVKKLRGEKAQIAAGLVDREREQRAYQEILDWCKEIKEARGELSYQRKRDFLELLGVVVTISYPTRPNEGSTYDMRVRLPALQEIISLPVPEEDALVTHTRSHNSVDGRWRWP